jgi:hypothetical protein
MNDATTIALQIFSILVSGGLLQFVTFVIKRADHVRKSSNGQTVKPDINIMFATEKELVKNVVEYKQEIASLKSKLKTCRSHLAAARRDEGG